MRAGSPLLPGVATGPDTIRPRCLCCLCPLPRATAESDGGGAASEENAALGTSRPAGSPRAVGPEGPRAPSPWEELARHRSPVGDRAGGGGLRRADARRAITALRKPEGFGTKGCSGITGPVEASRPLRAGGTSLLLPASRGRSAGGEGQTRLRRMSLRACTRTERQAGGHSGPPLRLPQARGRRAKRSFRVPLRPLPCRPASQPVGAARGAGWPLPWWRSPERQAASARRQALGKPMSPGTPAPGSCD